LKTKHFWFSTQYLGGSSQLQQIEEQVAEFTNIKRLESGDNRDLNAVSFEATKEQIEPFVESLKRSTGRYYLRDIDQTEIYFSQVNSAITDYMDSIKWEDVPDVPKEEEKPKVLLPEVIDFNSASDEHKALFLESFKTKLIELKKVMVVTPKVGDFGRRLGGTADYSCNSIQNDETLTFQEKLVKIKEKHSSRDSGWTFQLYYGHVASVDSPTRVYVAGTSTSMFEVIDPETMLPKKVDQEMIDLHKEDLLNYLKENNCTLFDDLVKEL
jgi:hypothetical protein